MATMRSAEMGPLCIMRVIVCLSRLNSTVSAQASKKAAAVSNGPPIPGNGPDSYPVSGLRMMVPILGRRNAVIWTCVVVCEEVGEWVMSCELMNNKGLPGTTMTLGD